MIKSFFRSIILLSFLIFLCTTHVTADVQRIYDQANLLTDDQVLDLQKKADSYYDEWNTDFVIITTEETDGKSIRSYMGDFTDELADDFNRTEDNMVVITISTGVDTGYREVYIAGFGLAEEYIDSERADMIIDHIFSYLSQDEYYEAFNLFFEKANDYLKIRPGVNPDSIFLNTFFQLAVAIGLAGIIVFFMAYNSGGRVTVTSGTYLDRSNSRIISKRDRYLRKTVTRRKRSSSNNKGGGGGFRGGGGGVTRAGRSHSGAGRRF